MALLSAVRTVPTLHGVKTHIDNMKISFVLKSIIFWDMTPCSPLGFNRRFGGTYRLHLQGQRNRFSKPASKHVESRAFCWFAEPISSTLKMEAICSSETSVQTQRTTRRHIPEDYTLHNHRCENLKSIVCLLVHFMVYAIKPVPTSHARPIFSKVFH
jgi:hypothetical protein